MNRRFAARRDELLADAEVDPAILCGVLPRMVTVPAKSRGSLLMLGMAPVVL
ncbi:MAG: hypothetical protein ACYC3I_02015 [Gemmataceae bacterium]